jgi:beta-glucosidase
MATAYHWDLPQTLQDVGGWANRDTAYRLADYTAALVEAYGDRIGNWLTLNEPWCFSWLGYANGVHAPGVQNLDHAIAAAHHTSLAHGLASRAMKSVNSDIRTGIALNMTNYRLEDPNDPDLAELGGLLDSHINRWWLDGIVHGAYPKNLVDLYGDKLQKLIHGGDMEVVKVQTDILGVNYYSDSFVGLPRENDKPMSEGGLFPFPQRSNGETPAPHTDMGWPITPEGLHDLPLRIARDWPEIEEISITENGAAYPEGPDENGDVVDNRRVEYLTSHIEALGRAVAEGAPVKSYYAWSFLDNYEWAEGYAKRFGIVHVDFETQVRTPKDSAKAYSSIISQQGDFSSLITR